MPTRPTPELLAPAGSLDAVRAAVANGANAVYLGAERFNARDEGAQLTLDELAAACAIAHAAGARIYLTLNTLVKPAELSDALHLLGEAIDRGVDAAIVQDIGLVRLIQRVYPEFEIHGSTQMTVHDASGARVMHALGIDRVVLARENTLEDIRAIRDAVPALGLETFVHGALCISYSGQCYMSGMISERSANRGSCAQSCRKDYVLRDVASGDELDRGYLISAKDLAAHDHLAALAEAGVTCLKVEGRKKKPEYVATVTHGYRTFLDRLADGRAEPPVFDEVRPLVQIFSRGNTSGMLTGRAGRAYITRDQPNNRGHELGRVVAREGQELVIEVSHPVYEGDGLGFEPPLGESGRAVGFSVRRVRTLRGAGGTFRQAIVAREAVPVGWRVVRSADATLLASARASFADPGSARTLVPEQLSRLDVRLFGHAGSPLKALFTADGETVDVRSEVTLAPAAQRALDHARLREQLGRLGGTPFSLGSLDLGGLGAGLFLPVSELNRLRQIAVETLTDRRAWSRSADLADRDQRIVDAIADLASFRRQVREPHLLAWVAGDNEPARAVRSSEQGEVSWLTASTHDKVVKRDRAQGAREDTSATLEHAGATERYAAAPRRHDKAWTLVAEVFTVADAHAAAEAGATEIVFDPFLRHPVPPASRLRTLADHLASLGVVCRLRTPTIVRPEERPSLTKWLDLGLPVSSGHLGLVAELAAQGRDVVADYATNCFNAHTAAELFRLGARRIVLSVELTAAEMGEVVEPWRGAGFDAVVYGRPEGMTIEHCVLSAAFDRVATTCRDLCVQKHPVVELTDPAGYTFPVATDAHCRNRLLHSRPIEASEFIPRLWQAGVRGYRALFNVPGEPVADVIRSYATALGTLAAGGTPAPSLVRERLNGAFTRGHFVRAV